MYKILRYYFFHKYILKTKCFLIFARKISMAQFHKLVIKEILKVTSNAVTISFSIPENLKDVFTFKAGQYITLKAIVNGEELRRDYSLCVSPNSGELKVAVKKVDGGAFSVYANTNLKSEDTLEVSEPNGRFVFSPNTSSKTVVAFTAGSGITPVMSIAKTLLEEEQNSKFVLVYGNKTPEDTIFHTELLALRSKYENRLDIHFIFSQTDVENSLFGRIDTSTVNYIVKNKYKDTTVDAFYLCGPEAMIKTVQTTLNDNGVKEESIFYELFTVPISDDNSNTVSVAEGETQIKILVDDEETSFAMSQKDSILDAALAKKIDAPYSCQGGVCSSCLARITEGEATMRQNNILTDAELAEGLVLTCQAHPTTSTIVVDYDDV